MLKRLLLSSFILFLAVTLVACNSNEKNEEEEAAAEETPPTESEVNSDSINKLKVDENEVVATVNGKDIKGNEFNTALQQVQTNMQMMGQNITDDNSEAVKQQIVDGLVGEELIVQDLDSISYDISDEEVNQQIEQIRGQYESKEQFEESFLKENDLTLEELEEEILTQMKIAQYLEKNIGEIEVTDTEIDEFYAKYKEQVEDAQKLDEIKDQIKITLEQSKQQEKIKEIIDSLKEKSEVQVNI